MAELVMVREALKSMAELVMATKEAEMSNRDRIDRIDQVVTDKIDQIDGVVAKEDGGRKPPPVTDQASRTNRRGLESIFQGLEPIAGD
eukprot:1194792-Prorocentrum_minimum.AAC.2